MRSLREKMALFYKMNRLRRGVLFLLLSLFLVSCGENQMIVGGVDERQANTIIVFLESRGIRATKTAVSSSGGLADTHGAPKYNIFVDASRTIDAMAILNQNGLPQRQGTSLLDLFAKQGLMSTDKEETIRYQAGLSQQIANMILLIDGVIDATVQISFPKERTLPTEKEENITAAVYVKHQGVIDDPNSHLETKIKRLVSGSVNGLNINNVTVVSDRSRFTDVSPEPQSERMLPAGDEYVRIWSMVMSKESASTFRTIFFFLLIAAILLLVALGWVIWKVYPTIRSSGGFGELFSPIPIVKKAEPKDDDE